MKLYQVNEVKIRVNGERGDEHEMYRGTDLQKAQEMYRIMVAHFMDMDTNGMKRTLIEAAEYDISEDTDLEDEDAVTNAMIECCGYDAFAPDYDYATFLKERRS